jgi:hypothetical protein
VILGVGFAEANARQWPPCVSRDTRCFPGAHIPMSLGADRRILRPGPASCMFAKQEEWFLGVDTVAIRVGARQNVIV